jgi:hypothetical protein
MITSTLAINPSGSTRSCQRERRDMTFHTAARGGRSHWAVFGGK